MLSLSNTSKRSMWSQLIFNKEIKHRQMSSFLIHTQVFKSLSSLLTFPPGVVLIAGPSQYFKVF
jgi:hypothetical protein